MSMSTGDVRRPSNQKSGTAAASDGPEAEVIDDGPKGGVLPPVKKALKRPGAISKSTSAPSETSSEAEPVRATPAAKSAKSAPAKATAARAAGTKATGAKVAGAKVAGAKAASARVGGATKSAGARPTGRPVGRPPAGRGKGRKPITPVRVAQSRNWGPILLYTLTGVLAVGIIAFGAWKVWQQDHQPSWQDRAADITGIQNYRQSNPDWFVYDPNVGNHKAGILTYPSSPPVGGVHNPHWQSCMGDVYTSEIAKEQAVHSLEHGAVWITYRPDLPQDQIDKLASRVRDVEFTMMSPYPGLDVPISLQAWGYQLKVPDANDDRIDQFINALRKNATQEPAAGCSGGITDATPTPLDLPGA
jgi:hypothetical protein